MVTNPSTKLSATLVNLVTSTVTVMTWISFIGGFYWPGIKSDVIDYIKGCERCQQVNRSALQKSSLELYNFPIPMKVMSQVGIDLMKLCETDGFEDEAGFQYVITAQCYFTKYIEIGTLRTKTGLEGCQLDLHEHFLSLWCYWHSH